MPIYQLTGLSGSGKTTLANRVSALLEKHNIETEIIDGDVYRQTLCKGLGFSKEDRHENMRRLGAVAHTFHQQNKIVLIAAINPYEVIRRELTVKYGARTIWIQCSLEVLRQRDPKGLYQRAFLPDGHPDKIYHFTGVDDAYEIPASPELIVQTHKAPIEDCVQQIIQFILYK